MEAVIGFVAPVVALLPLTVAGLGHTLHPYATISAIQQQEVWPRQTVPLVYVVLVATELAAGGGGLIGVVLHAQTWMITSLFAATVLYVVFASYSAVLLRWRPNAPCGCSSRPRPTSWWSLLRAAILACVAALAVAVDSQQSLWDGELFRAVVLLSASIVFTILIWLLPEVMPGARRGLGAA